MHAIQLLHLWKTRNLEWGAPGSLSSWWTPPDHPSPILENRESQRVSQWELGIPVFPACGHPTHWDVLLHLILVGTHRVMSRTKCAKGSGPVLMSTRGLLPPHSSPQAPNRRERSSQGYRQESHFTASLKCSQATAAGSSQDQVLISCLVVEGRPAKVSGEGQEVQRRRTPDKFLSDSGPPGGCPGPQVLPSVSCQVCPN